MNKLTPKNDISDYLKFSEIVNCTPLLEEKAKNLTDSQDNQVEKARTLFEFVRDKIAHSFDIKNTEVTCRASDVFEKGHGICFAKSHLLAAMCRSVGIPSGLCYQKLVFDDQAKEKFFTLHGLNAVYLESLKRWVRLDARGNKPGVFAEFDIQKEKLAFPVRLEMKEVDYPEIFSQPQSSVTQGLTQLIKWDLSHINRQLPESL